MKKLIGLMGCVIFFSSLNAQTLIKKFTWKDKTLLNAELTWADIDNDSLLDVVLVGKDNQQKLKIIFLNNKLDSFIVRPSIVQNLPMQTYAIKDIDHDNLLDIIQILNTNAVTGSSVLINKGNFSFQQGSRKFPIVEASSTFNTIIDLDNDGKEDWLVGGSNFIKIFQATDTIYQLKLDSINIAVESVMARDFNKDGWNDIIISGFDKNGNAKLQYWLNKGKFKFKSVVVKNPIAGKIESGDFNHDGWFDFIVAGKNSKKLDQINYYRNDSTNFSVRDSIQGYGKSQLLLADLDSDGLADLSFNGVNSAGKKYNKIKNSVTSLLTSLDTTGLITQRWGDYDRDGNLDLATLKDSAGYKVVWIYKTNASPNKTPQRVGLSFAFSTFNKTFLYWQAATDDKTPAKALTYDVYLGQVSKSKSLINPEFRYGNKRRTLVSHGNETTNNFAVINNLSDTRYTFLIQPVDNAFNGGVCYGGGVMACFDLKHQYVQACQDEIIQLASSQSAYWFSSTRGFLQMSSTYKFAALNDTIVSVVPQANDCAKNNVWVIKVNGVSKVDKATKYVCENSIVKLGIEPGWKSTVWLWGTSKATTDSVLVQVSSPLLVKVSAASSSCTYSKEFKLKISKPVVAVNDKKLVIQQGESVQLNATPGFKKYVWTTPVGLDNSAISNPIATPIRSTIYYLKASDSVGCVASDTVEVDVVDTAFVPALFTPNGDGKNDEFKILGLTYADDFQFTIFNREGIAVYESTQWLQAATQGWNGTNSGTQQPSGLYYWKIVGKQSDGQPLRLNGKTKGSILLVR